MEIKIRKSTIICVILILIFMVTTGVLAYELLNTKQNNEEKIGKLQNQVHTLERILSSTNERLEANTTTNENNNSSTNNTKASEKQTLNINQLSEIESFLNKEENNGFIQSEYDNIDQIQWIDVLLCASNSIGNNSNEVYKEYSRLNGGSLGITVYKYNSKNLIKFIKEKTGKEYTVQNLKNMFKEYVCWSKNDEDCYIEVGDSAFNFIKCTEGYMQGEKYIIKGKFDNLKYNSKLEEVTTFTVTLQKDDKGYIFISNDMK